MAESKWDDLLSIGEVAAEYRVSEETVRRWIRNGHIDYVMVGPFKIKRIRRGDVVKNATTGATLEEEEPILMRASQNGRTNEVSAQSVTGQAGQPENNSGRSEKVS